MTLAPSTNWPTHSNLGKACEKDEQRTQVLAEYAALRAQIIVTMQLRDKVRASVILTLGAFLGLGLQDIVTPTVVLCYPILILFFAIEFARRDLRIAQIGDYIRYYVESRCPELWWERYFQDVVSSSKWFHGVTWFGAIGTFVGSGILAVLLIVIVKRHQFSLLDWGLLCVDIVVLVFVWHLLGTRHRRPKPPATLERNKQPNH